MNTTSPASKPAINKTIKITRKIRVNRAQTEAATVENAGVPAAWTTLMKQLEVAPAAGVATFLALAARYRQPERAYHNLDHARQVVATVSALARYAPVSLAVPLAAWFHDAIYQPGAGDSEALSAAYARRQLAVLGIAPPLLAETERLIHLTRTHLAESDDHDGQVLADADLAILAAPAATYAAYARAVRREYADVDEATYRRGRARVLRRLLARAPLYYTPAWRQSREPRARRNLRRELALLADSSYS